MHRLQSFQDSPRNGGASCTETDPESTRRKSRKGLTFCGDRCSAASTMTKIKLFHACGL